MPYKYREIKQRLEKIGYTILRQKGSHVIFGNGKNTIPVPNHGGKDISPGVERSIITMLQLPKKVFDNI